MEDKNVTCEECGTEFIFTAGEQEFYNEKGFQQPKKCKTCRDAAKAAKRSSYNDRRGN